MLDDIREGIRDNYGNRIYMKGNDIFLKLEGDEKIRKLGWIDDDKLVVIRNSKHIMRINNSWGFNYMLLNNLDRDMDVVVMQGKRSKINFKTKVGMILDNGSFLHFLNKGFEKQIFLPIECFGLF